MIVPQAIREQLRKEYNYRCGYCGTEEIQIGNKLEVDHFQPHTQGGTNDINNLVYCCHSCNRFKSNYWPRDDAPISQHLLHPREDDLTSHIELTEQGMLIGLTARGWFHIQWLRLNRPQLIQSRLLRQQRRIEQKLQTKYEHMIEQLRQQNQSKAIEIARLRALIARLRNN